MITDDDKAKAEVSEICKNCGQVVLFMREPDTTQSVKHDGCKLAVVSMVVMRSCYLGIVKAFA